MATLPVAGSLLPKKVFFFSSQPPIGRNFDKSPPKRPVHGGSSFVPIFEVVIRTSAAESSLESRKRAPDVSSMKRPRAARHLLFTTPFAANLLRSCMLPLSSSSLNFFFVELLGRILPTHQATMVRRMYTGIGRSFPFPLSSVY